VRALSVYTHRQRPAPHAGRPQALPACQVWEADESAPAERPPGGGESVAEVVARVRALLAGLEAEHAGRTLLLVSHGDLLSILVAAALGSPLREHRRHAFRPGELRRLAARVPPAS